MPDTSERSGRTATIARAVAFVIERFPFALPLVQRALETAALRDPGRDPAQIERCASEFRAALEVQINRLQAPGELDTTPGVTAGRRLASARSELLAACDGFFAREAIAASLTRDERREILRGMVLTRAIDNRLKQFFVTGEVGYKGTPFQGKGFRSLGQEAIYAAGIRLRRGAAYRSEERGWQGDVVGPIIRDAGVALAMRPEPATVRMILNAQMGKTGPPMDGKDLHIGDLEWGILPASAPLSISTMSIAGMAMAFARESSPRVAISFIGEGGSSLGEWHEAINLCAVRRLPAVFCLENNQIALSTPAARQSAARVFADKASGYGIPGITIDGTDPDAVAAAVTWAANRARTGDGPALIELVTLRMAGHAHHDDMLYLGRDPRPSWEYAPPDRDGAYADRDLFAQWSARDPLLTYSARLEAEGVVARGELDKLKAEAEAVVETEARAVIDAPWPDAASAAIGVLACEPPRVRLDPLAGRPNAQPHDLPAVEAGPPHDPKGSTFLEGVAMGIADTLRSDERVFVFGEDVGEPYGNAFLLLRPLLHEFGDRIIDSTLAEGAVLGVCVGAALAGQRPIGEIQFNDFVASGFNQLVNNAAKIRYRWGGSVPMVVRLPWGGLRHAGPYHSQNTEAWFYRTPGLKIVAPSTPADARALMIAAVADPDPVLFYEHIALYREPRIRQRLTSTPAAPLPIGVAALRRAGADLALISYGAYVHVAMRVAERLAADGIEASVLDLRTLAPLDKAAVLAVARHASRVLIVHEDSRTGGIGESLAAIIQEEAFEWLDAPVRIIGALDTPVPYSPPLEEFFLPSEEEVERAARLLVAY
ncbi:MAG TPA: thiamine pyrophosphate-dependent enzyme [Vicinamibacterales bacterium]|nr:thiamine pyrophosphate-dependent enzyme [Vicinamibacterales bacterium]